MTELLVALGANLPQADHAPVITLRQALAQMQARLGVVSASRFYRTPAVPAGSGPDYVNAAARVDCAMVPEDALEVLHRIEADLGRNRTTRWAPRVCDLDLLAAGDLVLPDVSEQRRWMRLDLGKAQTVSPPHLILPHPRMQERAFVLVPLAEIAPDWRHPVLHKTVGEMREALSEADRAAISPLETAG